MHTVIVGQIHQNPFIVTFLRIPRILSDFHLRPVHGISLPTLLDSDPRENTVGTSLSTTKSTPTTHAVFANDINFKTCQIMRSAQETYDDVVRIELVRFTLNHLALMKVTISTKKNRVSQYSQ